MAPQHVIILHLRKYPRKMVILRWIGLILIIFMMTRLILIALSNNDMNLSLFQGDNDYSLRHGEEPHLQQLQDGLENNQDDIDMMNSLKISTKSFRISSVGKDVNQNNYVQQESTTFSQQVEVEYVKTISTSSSSTSSSSSSSYSTLGSDTNDNLIKKNSLIDSKTIWNYIHEANAKITQYAAQNLQDPLRYPDPTFDLNSHIAQKQCDIDVGLSFIQRWMNKKVNYCEHDSFGSSSSNLNSKIDCYLRTDPRTQALTKNTIPMTLCTSEYTLLNGIKRMSSEKKNSWKAQCKIDDVLATQIDKAIVTTTSSWLRVSLFSHFFIYSIFDFISLVFLLFSIIYIVLMIFFLFCGCCVYTYSDMGYNRILWMQKIMMKIMVVRVMMKL